MRGCEQLVRRQQVWLWNRLCRSHILGRLQMRLDLPPIIYRSATAILNNDVRLTSAIFALVLCLSVGAPPLAAQQQQGQEGRGGQSVLDKLGTFADFDDLELDDLLHTTVSIAAGRTQTLEEAPSIVSVITDEQIRQTGVRTVAEALQLSPGIVVLTDNFGRGRIAIRGVSSGLTSGSSENVLLLFNGHRLNDEISGGATIQNLDIPVDGVRKIEIIRGPGSALFGANAFLGAINIISYKADTFDGLRLAAGGGSFSTGEGSLVFGRSVGRLSVAGFAQYSRTDGPAVARPGRRADVYRRRAHAVRLSRRLARAGADRGRSQVRRREFQRCLRGVDGQRPRQGRRCRRIHRRAGCARHPESPAGQSAALRRELQTERRQQRRPQRHLLLHAECADAVYRGVSAAVHAGIAHRQRDLMFFPNGLSPKRRPNRSGSAGKSSSISRSFERNTITTGISLEGESTFDLKRARELRSVELCGPADAATAAAARAAERP